LEETHMDALERPQSLLFWFLVQSRLGLFGDNQCHGLRDGWQIVAWENRGQQNMPPFLKNILGIQ
jgi:hypothetical protein